MCIRDRSEDKAKEIGQYMAVATVVVLVVSANIIAAVASGGSTLTGAAAMIFQAVRLIQGISQAALLGAQGGADIANAIYVSNASEDRADEASIRAELTRLQTHRDQMLKDLKRTSQLINSINAVVPQMLANFSEGEEVTIQHMV